MQSTTLFPLPSYALRIKAVQQYVEYACEGKHLEQFLRVCREALTNYRNIAQRPSALNAFIRDLFSKFQLATLLGIDLTPAPNEERKQRNQWASTFLTALLTHLNNEGYIDYNSTTGLTSVHETKQEKRQTVTQPIAKKEKVTKNEAVVTQQPMAKKEKVTKKALRQNRTLLINKLDETAKTTKAMQKCEKIVSKELLQHWGLTLSSLGFATLKEMVQQIKAPKGCEWKISPFAGQISFVVTKLMREAQNKSKEVQEKQTKLEAEREKPSLVLANKKAPLSVPSGPVIVDSQDSAQLAHVQLSQCKIVAVDVEGELRKNGEVWMIQFAFADKDQTPKAYLFDLLCKESSSVVQVAKTILENEAILKVFHDCRKDSEALYHLLHINIQNISDTQVMFALCNKIKLLHTNTKWKSNNRISLNDLLQHYNCSVNSSKKSMHELFEDRESFHTLWKKRPLDPKVISYACEDVLYLGEAYHKLLEDLQQSTEQCGESLSEEHVLSHLKPDKSLVESLPERYMRFSRDCKAHYFTDPYENLEEEEQFVLTPAPFLGLTTDQEFDALLHTLPESLRNIVVQRLKERGNFSLVEIKIDRGRPPVMLYSDGYEEYLPHEPIDIYDSLSMLARSSGIKIKNDDYSVLFTSDRRMGLPGMLHRISVIQDRRLRYNGLTYRIGRHIPGVVEIVCDLVSKISQCTGSLGSLLLLGPPGVGKTTLLRSIIQLLSTKFRKRVVVVDTSNEIAGDGDIPHPCIGFARRIEVPRRRNQHEILIEAVQNHNPEIIVVDEIGNTAEASAAKTISQRGVSLVGTAHGTDLVSLLRNPELNSLLGGVRSVTLGDSTAAKQRKLKGGELKKTVFERGGTPIFGTVIEIVNWNYCRLFKNTSIVVDAILSQSTCFVEDRWIDNKGKFVSRKVIYGKEDTPTTPAHWFDQLCSHAKKRETNPLTS